MHHHNAVVNRRSFLRTLGLGAALAAPGARLAAAQGAAAKPPNFVFIFADDLGWGDLGCYGNQRIKTPSLDKLARQGTLFTQFYVSGSVCSPSRTAIMTGHFPARHGVHGHFAAPANNKQRGMPDFLDPKVMTLTRLLQQNGYATGHIGKWHLGSGPGAPEPGAYGIDHYKTNTSNDPAAGNDFNLWRTDLRPVAAKMTMDETLAFIEKNKDRPFYVNCWHVDPHATLNPSEEQLAQYKQFKAKGVKHYGATQIYYACVSELDRQIGLFLDKLDQLGLAENTVVIFSSDNGPEDIEISNSAHSGVGNAGPFRGRKRSIYEGGVRVPFIVRWPKGTPAGRVDVTSVIGGVDFLPTICALAGAKLPGGLQLDGEDMSGALRGQPKQRTKPLMWEWRYRIFGHPLHHSPILAIRDGKWKLLLNPDKSRVELYDIPSDPAEMQNLAPTHPEIVRLLSEKVLDWARDLPQSPRDATAGASAWPWPKGK